MAEKIKEDKVVLEREYIIPLRKKYMKVPKYRRTPKAIKAIKEFLARHMKTRDTTKIKLDMYLNEEMWMGSIRKPPGKIRVKCKKFESGIVKVELAEIPQFIKWKIAREIKKKEIKVVKKPEEKKEAEKGSQQEEESSKNEQSSSTRKPHADEEKKEEKTETQEEKIEKEEKGKSVVEAGLKQQDIKAREMKHKTQFKSDKKSPMRKSLQK